MAHDPLQHVPGDRGWPLVGHTLMFVHDARAFTERNRTRYGDVFRSRVLGREGVTFLTPQATREVFLDPGKVLSSAGGWSNTIGDLFRNGLMLRDFDDHHRHRRVMQQAFSRAALTGYVDAIHDVTDRHLRELPAGDVDVYVLMKRLTLDIAAEVFVGVSLGAASDRVNRAFQHAVAASITPLRVAVPGTPWRRGVQGRAELVRVFGDLVAARRREAEPRSDLLSRLAHARTDEGELLPVEDVVDHMVFLMLAAHDTTTSTLAVLLWQLALHPAEQDRVAQEVRALDGAPVTPADHGDLVHTTRAMQEALRLSPPVPFSPRRALADVEITGVRVPAGTGVSVSSLALHRHPDWWTRPDAFDPDRFAPGREEHKQHSHLFVPFGGGAHLCIGNHVAEVMVKAIVARLLATRRVTADPRAGVVISPVPIPKPKGPMLLTVG